MKLTRNQLKRIIIQEMRQLNEGTGANAILSHITNATSNASLEPVDQYNALIKGLESALSAVKSKLSSVTGDEQQHNDAVLDAIIRIEIENKVR